MQHVVQNCPRFPCVTLCFVMLTQPVVPPQRLSNWKYLSVTFPVLIAMQGKMHTSCQQIKTERKKKSISYLLISSKHSKSLELHGKLSTLRFHWDSSFSFHEKFQSSVIIFYSTVECIGWKRAILNKNILIFKEIKMSTILSNYVKRF